jgi:hypothetical protein
MRLLTEVLLRNMLGASAAYVTLLVKPVQTDLIMQSHLRSRNVGKDSLYRSSPFFL